MRGEWSPQDTFILRKLYPSTPNGEIAATLDRDLLSIRNKATKLGLMKSARYLARAKPGQFRAGHETWNKGKPGVTGNHPNCRRTQFRKGRHASEARNYRPIGSLRICRDGYLERKVSDDPSVYPARRWVGVHRLVWEAANGPVPRGQIVVFKPGKRTTNEAEVTLDRLELISRAENMRRNSYHNYPQPIPQLIQLRGALQRQINKRGKA